jgi:hypothetical protein
MASFEAYLVEAATAVGDVSLATVDLRWDIAAAAFDHGTDVPSCLAEAVQQLRDVLLRAVGPARGGRLARDVRAGSAARGMTSQSGLLLGCLLLLGLLVGSFLNVVIARVPEGRSILSPGSACLVCQHPVRGYDNVPMLSWFVLRGRCRDCSAPISWRYPAVEATTGVLFVAAGLRFGWTPYLGVALVLLARAPRCS